MTLSDEARMVALQKLSAMKDKWLGDLPGRVATIGEKMAVWRAGGWQEEAGGEVYLLVHSLSGSGATFGAPAISQLAFALEMAVQAVRQEGANESRCQMMEEHFISLAREAAVSS